MFNFADNVKGPMSLLFKEVLQLQTTFIPKKFSAQFERPSLEETVAQHLSRFSQGVGETPRTDQPDQETPGVSS